MAGGFDASGPLASTSPRQVPDFGPSLPRRHAPIGGRIDFEPAPVRLPKFAEASDLPDPHQSWRAGGGKILETFAHATIEYCIYRVYFAKTRNPKIGVADLFVVLTNN